MTRATFVGILAGTLCLLATSLPAHAAQTLDKIVAVVGQGVILDSELDHAVQRIRRNMGNRASRVPENVLRTQVLDRLILRHIQLQHARRRGLTVSNKMLDQAMRRLAQRNGMTLQEFKEMARAHGIEISRIRERIHENLLIQKLRRKQVVSRVSVSAEEVNRYLASEQLRVQKNREYHIRHILIAVSDQASQEAVEQARQHIQHLRELAVSGKREFAELALAHSDGQQALKGGDLGWIRGGYLPTLFNDIVPKLSPGEVSKVFKGPGGLHLIKLVGIRGQHANKPIQKSATVREVKARHILVKITEIFTNKRAKKAITEIRNRVLAGGSFAQLARSRSDDPKTASQGGDMGWVRPASKPPAVAKRLRNLDIGEISQPFRTDKGWQIIQVLDRRTRDVSKQRRRRRARQAIGHRKIKAKATVWRHKLRDEAYVDIRMEGYVEH